jgi:hypothetical protein
MREGRLPQYLRLCAELPLQFSKHSSMLREIQRSHRPQRDEVAAGEIRQRLDPAQMVNPYFQMRRA